MVRWRKCRHHPLKEPGGKVNRLMVAELQRSSVPRRRFPRRHSSELSGGAPPSISGRILPFAAGSRLAWSGRAGQRVGRELVRLTPADGNFSRDGASVRIGSPAQAMQLVSPMPEIAAGMASRYACNSKRNAGHLSHRSIWSAQFSPSGPWAQSFVQNWHQNGAVDTPVAPIGRQSRVVPARRLPLPGYPDPRRATQASPMCQG